MIEQEVKMEKKSENEKITETVTERVTERLIERQKETSNSIEIEQRNGLNLEPTASQVENSDTIIKTDENQVSEYLPNKNRTKVMELLITMIAAAFSLVSAFLVPLAEKTGEYIQYCSLLLIGYVACSLLVYYIFSRPSRKMNVDSGISHRRIIKITITFGFIMMLISSITYSVDFYSRLFREPLYSPVPIETTESTETTEMDRLSINPKRFLAAGDYHNLIITENGTVESAGMLPQYLAEIEKWVDIVAVSGNRHAVGLKSDGTVVATGVYEDSQCKVSDWEDIVDIDAGYYNTIGAHRDGTVEIVGSNGNHQHYAEDWDNIIQVEVGDKFAYGLKDDGTVVVAGDNADKECSVSNWEDIIAISAGQYHLVALKSDGTVVATGRNNENQCNVSEWTDIISIAAGSRHTVGLKSDGTVVSTQFPDDVKNDKKINLGQCDIDEEKWKNIVAIGAGVYHTIGINRDGEIIQAGSNANGQFYFDDDIRVFIPDD